MRRIIFFLVAGAVFAVGCGADKNKENDKPAAVIQDLDIKTD